MIADGFHGFGRGADDRPTLEGYVSLGLLADPLQPEKMDYSESSTSEDTIVYVGNNLWFGWYYKNPVERGMFKIGDRWAWTDPQTNRTHRFSLLVNDPDNVNFDDSQAYSDGHPDADGVMSAVVWRNEFASEGADITPLAAAVKMYRAVWVTTQTHERGPMDSNTALSDGAVVRYEGVRVQKTEVDERMTLVPVHNGGPDWAGNPGWYGMVPIR